MRPHEIFHSKIYFKRYNNETSAKKFSSLAYKISPLCVPVDYVSVSHIRWKCCVFLARGQRKPDVAGHGIHTTFQSYLSNFKVSIIWPLHRCRDYVTLIKLLEKNNLDTSESRLLCRDAALSIWVRESESGWGLVWFNYGKPNIFSLVWFG